MIKRLIFPLLILALAITAFFGLKYTKPEHAVLEKAEKVWRVNTTPVELQSRSPEITIYGRIETPRESTLTSALVADVINVHVLEGTEVTAGDVLVELDNTDMHLLVTQRQADLAEIKAMLNSEAVRFDRDIKLLENEKQLLKLADANVARTQKLQETRLASQVTLDKALADKQRQFITLKQLEHDIAGHPARVAQLKAKKQRAQALLEQAQVDLERCHINAPFTGRISQLNVAVGDRVRAGNNVLSIYDLSNLEVRAQLPGRYIKQLKTMIANNHDLTATADIDGKYVEFVLTRFSGEVRPDSGGIDGLFKLSADDLALPLGTFVELRMTLAEQENLIDIPYNALYELDKVFLFKDGYLEAVKVKRVGEFNTDDGEKRLLVRNETLVDGDQIVITQLPNAITGLRVEVVSD